MTVETISSAKHVSFRINLNPVRGIVNIFCLGGRNGRKSCLVSFRRLSSKILRNKGKRAKYKQKMREEQTRNVNALNVFHNNISWRTELFFFLSATWNISRRHAPKRCFLSICNVCVYVILQDLVLFGATNFQVKNVKKNWWV